MALIASRDGFVTRNTMEITHWAPITLFPSSSRRGRTGRARPTTTSTRKKNQFWKETQEVPRGFPATTTTRCLRSGPNNPFGGPNAAAVFRDGDKRKASERFVFEGEHRTALAVCGRLSGANKKMGVVIAEYLPAEPDLPLPARSLRRRRSPCHSRALTITRYEEV